jgi:ribosomal protein S27AE
MRKDWSDKIIEILKERRINTRCPRCSVGESYLVGFSQLPLSNDPRESVVGGASVPVAIVVCPKCGFVMQHSLVALGIIPEEAEVAG